MISRAVPTLSSSPVYYTALPVGNAGTLERAVVVIPGGIVQSQARSQLEQGFGRASAQPTASLAERIT